MSSTTYRDGGVSLVTYDANGNVRGVRNALGKWTYFDRDGFGQAWKVTGPATNVPVQYTYDAAGNVLTKTDARGTVTTYGYDSLNRLVSLQPGSMPAMTFDYDTDRKGFLYRVIDEAGTHTFTRNEAGEIRTRTDVVAGTTLAMSYTYDNMGRVNVMTYPSGLHVDYDYDPVGDVEKVRAWKTGLSVRDVVREIESYPWGPLDEYRFGNGEYRRYYRDRSYRSTQLLSGAHLNLTKYYDADGNIRQIGSNRTYTYDEMDRLASHTGPDGSFLYDYDLNGNRLWHKRNGITTTYNYNPSKTRLNSRTGGISETRAYDANGNTTRIGSQYFDYNDNDRLWRYRFGTQTVTYKYNAFGERMLKQVGSTATRYVYDGPQLLHERTGSATRDYIWLAGEVVGFVKGTTLYYVHNDHLGRPQVISNAAKQKVWEAQANAFDSAPVLDAIGGFHLGFPGQYYDEESGTWYNYFRTYDPSSGRYLQSDPIGLAGGLNTYGYAAANPLRYVDPTGLSAGVAVWGTRVVGGALCAVPLPGARVIGIGMIIATIPGDTPIDSDNEEDSSDAARPDLSGNSASPDPDDDDVAAESLIIGPKVTKQMGPRGWTRTAIVEARTSGQQIRAINKANGNPATRYVHPETGQSVVIDDVTGEVIHIGGPGFRYGPASGDLP